MSDIADTLNRIVGDVPVSEQICIALKNHTHDSYVTHDEFEKLNKIVDALVVLVGDMSVSEQISAALKNTK